MEQNNPLANHFRSAEIYITLPSLGNFYQNNSLEYSPTGEYPVYPMTMKDEIKFKTPDALLNGSSTADVITSCFPSISDPWAMPIIDLDPILIAIRIASYGNEMDFESTCPHCNTKNENVLDLRDVLNTVAPAEDYLKPVQITDKLSFKFRPLSFKSSNKTNQIQFEQNKLIALLQDESMPEEEKRAIFQENLASLTNLNLDSLVECISEISDKNSGAIVSDGEFIREYIEKVDRATYKKIKDTALELAKKYSLKPINIQCQNEECKKEYTSIIEFNQTNFFE
jgi:hypothetical protein